VPAGWPVAGPDTTLAATINPRANGHLFSMSIPSAVGRSARSSTL
jgi:hypothetical protein